MGDDVLINAPHDKEFVFQDGFRAKNLLELVSHMEHLSDHEFHHFVNNHKNDFASWNEHVLLDKHFAEKLRALGSRNDTIQLIKEKIHEATIGNSIIKIPRIEDHSETHSEHHDQHHDKHGGENEKNSHSPNHSHEKHTLDDVPSIEEKEKKHEKSVDLKTKRNWFQLFSKKKFSEKKLEKIEKKEEDKLRPESELKEEIESDGKENALWMVLYIVLILLVIIFLAYKLFLS